MNLKSVPVQVMQDLEYEIARNELECVDNFRFARFGNDQEEEAYDKQRARGCCGEFDVTTKVDGVKWMIGCNYGH